MATPSAEATGAPDGSYSPAVADGSYLLCVHVEELSVDKTLRVKGDLHVGGAMFKLVESLAIHADWSDYAFWWPERKKWLTKLRLTLDQYGVHADSRLLFTSMHKLLRVQLPDLQVIEMKVNFSVNVFNAVLQLARELGIRHAEELSLVRRLEDRFGRASKSKGAWKDAHRKGGCSSMGGRCLSGSSSVSSSLPRDVGSGAGGGLRLSTIMSRPLSPRVLAATSGSLRGGAMSATNSPQSTLLKCPSLLSPGSHLSWRPDGWPSGTLSPIGRSLSLLSAGRNTFGYDLVHSPRVTAAEALAVLGQPKTHVDRAWTNNGWLNSSRSLMEQGIRENDLLRLRFKYYDFYDLSPQYDSVRLNQLYEQARWQLISEEVWCNEDEMMMFAALQLQVERQLEAGGDESDGVLQHPQNQQPGKSLAGSDVDEALNSLQAQLLGSSNRNTADITQLPELHDYLRHFKPRKYTVRGAKRYWCVLRDTDVLLYVSKQAQASCQKPIRTLKLKECEVQPFVNVSQHRFVIKLVLPRTADLDDSSHGLSEEWLKCESPTQYARWIVACKFGSEGKTMADASYDNEVQALEGLLSLQQPQSMPIDMPDRCNISIDPTDYVASRFVGFQKSKVCQKILDAHLKVKQMSLTEAKMNFVKAWRSLPSFGIVYFLVKFKNAKKEELLGIAWNRLIRMDCRKGDVAKTYRYTTLKAWNIQWEIKEMTVEFDEETLSFRCLSADLKTVHEFIGGYIFLAMRSQEKNQSLNEEMFHRLTGGHVQ